MSHLSDSDIQAYAFRRLDDDEAEEHILNCSSCLDRVIAEEGWIAGVRLGLEKEAAMQC